jgi:hypothetical protein
VVSSAEGPVPSGVKGPASGVGTGVAEGAPQAASSRMTTRLSRPQIARAGFAIQRSSGGLQIRHEQEWDLLRLAINEAFIFMSLPPGYVF